LYTLLVGHAPFLSDNVQHMYQMIMRDGVIKYPPYITEDTRAFIEGLLTRDPNKRFGPEEIRKHAFFSKYDWGKLERGEIAPPFVPIIRNENEDTKYFYKEFTSENFRNESFCEPFNPKDADFRGFSFEQRELKQVHDEKW